MAGVTATIETNSQVISFGLATKLVVFTFFLIWKRPVCQMFRTVGLQSQCLVTGEWVRIFYSNVDDYIHNSGFVLVTKGGTKGLVNCFSGLVKITVAQ